MAKAQGYSSSTREPEAGGFQVQGQTTQRKPISKAKVKQEKNKERKGLGICLCPSMDPQNLCKKLGTTCNPLAGEVNSGDGGLTQPASLTEYVSSRLSEKSCSKNVGGKRWFSE